jgi:hypothetical protein
MLPDFDRVDAIGSYWGNPKTRIFALQSRALRTPSVSPL